MSGTYTNYEYFQTMYAVSYTPGSGAATVTPPATNLENGAGVYASLSISSGTELTPGTTGTISTETVTTSGRSAGTATQSASPTSSSSFTYVGVAYDAGNPVGVIIESGGSYYVVTVYNNGYTTAFANNTALTVNTATGWNLDGTNYSSSTSPAYNEDGNPTVACFLAGTMIATPAGEVAVESLKAGDMVTTAEGGVAAVTWLGRQTISTVFADKSRVTPIRVKAGALADGIPARDLRLSPDHALLVDGVLAHAGALTNGTSIVRESQMPESFVYYHVETANHELILAEGAAAETFIDNAGRMNFDNWNEHSGTAALVEMALPRAKSARQLPAAIHIRLVNRAASLSGTERNVA